MEYQNKIDIIKCSKELKKLIKERIKELNYSIALVCENAGVKYEKFRYYLNCADPLDENARVSQAHILRVCEQLGIVVKIKLIIQDVEKTKRRNRQRVRLGK